MCDGTHLTPHYGKVLTRSRALRAVAHAAHTPRQHHSRQSAHGASEHGTPARFFHLRVKWHVQTPTLYAVFSASTPCMSSISHWPLKVSACSRMQEDID